MASTRRRTTGRIRRQTAGSSIAEQVECCDELITDILSRVSTRDLLRMSTVSKRWRTLIFDPDFVHTHCKNRHRELIICLTEFIVATFSPTGLRQNQYEFRSFNYQTGNVLIVPFTCEAFASSFEHGYFMLLTASNGLLCFYPRFRRNPPLWMYNPVRKVLKKLSTPFPVNIDWVYFAEICYMQNTLKFVMAGFAVSQKRRYTLVFDSHSNSWYEGPPLLPSIEFSDYNCIFGRTQLFFNGVIYFVARVKSIDDQQFKEIRDGEALFRDASGLFQMILGYDVNRDQWGFSIVIPSSVGSIYCLTEWKGNLLVCAARVNGHFVFWILDTEHKLWIRERDLDLSHKSHTSWKVSASGGVMWFRRDNSVNVKVYHMKNRHWSTYQLDDAFPPQKQISRAFVTFETTLLSF